MNEFEKQFRDNGKKRHCLTFHNGFPDFLVVPEYDRRVGFFVEVKSRNTPYLTLAQQETFRALSEAGMPVSISYDGEWDGVWAQRLDFLNKNLLKKMEEKLEGKPRIYCERWTCRFNARSIGGGGVCLQRAVYISENATCMCLEG